MPDDQLYFLRRGFLNKEMLLGEETEKLKRWLESGKASAE